MRASMRVLSFSITAALALGAGPVMALGGFEDGIPNGAFGGTDQCIFCHTMTTGGPRNAFGSEFEGLLSVTDILAEWQRLSREDSDGDGATNGLELGDPCGDWTSGQMPERTMDISNPGDMTLTTMAAPVECAPLSGGVVDTTAAGAGPKHPGFQQGFCAVAAGVGAGSSAWGLLALGAAVVVLGTRRRARATR